MGQVIEIADRMVYMERPRCCGKTYRLAMTSVFKTAAMRARNPEFVDLWRNKAALAVFLPTSELMMRPAPGPVDFTPDAEPARRSLWPGIALIAVVAMVIDVLPVWGA